MRLHRDERAPAFVLEVRLGRLHVSQHPSLVDWSGPQRAGMMSADGWAAAARHRRRRLAATRMYVQVRGSVGRHHSLMTSNGRHNGVNACAAAAKVLNIGASA